MVELREKFETAVPSIEQKLSLEAERRRAQHEENEMLRAKLEAFMTQTSQRYEFYSTAYNDTVDMSFRCGLVGVYCTN